MQKFNSKCVRKYITGILIFFSYIAVTCDYKENTSALNVIDVEKTVGKYNILNLSDYIEGINYITLETNKSSLISVIRQIIYENEKILVLDQIPGTYTSNCYLFDSNGKFYRKIGQLGQGPGDYNFIFNVSIQEKCIYLTDRHKILTYDLNGNQIDIIHLLPNEIPLEYINLRSVIPLKKDTFVMNVTSVSGNYPKAILLNTYKSHAKIIKEYPQYIKLNKISQSLSTHELGFMYHFQENIRIYKPICDTIFTICKNAEIEDAFIFQFGKYKPALSFFEAREDYLEGMMKYIIPQSINESFKHLFIEFSFGKHSPEPVELKNAQGGAYSNTKVCSVFDKFNSKLILMSQPIKGKFGFKNDIDNGPVIWPRYISSNNELVTYISPEEFMDYYKKIDNPNPRITEIAEKIRMDDNPIIIIAKLKS